MQAIARLAFVGAHSAVVIQLHKIDGDLKQIPQRVTLFIGGKALASPRRYEYGAARNGATARGFFELVKRTRQGFISPSVGLGGGGNAESRKQGMPERIPNPIAHANLIVWAGMKLLDFSMG
jgi:hypothetical protein